MAPPLWQKTFGGTDYDWGSSIQQTTDGGFILTGLAVSWGAGSGDVLVMKLDAGGNVGPGCAPLQCVSVTEGIPSLTEGVPSLTIGDPEQPMEASSLTTTTPLLTETLICAAPLGNIADEAQSIQQTTDGGYIVAGQTQSCGAGGWDFWVLKLKPDNAIVGGPGQIEWQKTYGGANNDFAHSIQQTSDGGYIVAGLTQSFCGGNDFWVLKLDSFGNPEWQKIYNKNEEIAYSIQQTDGDGDGVADDGYIVAGVMLGAGHDFWVLKLDGGGNIEWQKAYGGDGFDEAYSIQQTSDGGYIVAGWTEPSVGATRDFWVLKLNGDGSVAWQKTYGRPSDDYASSIQQTSDGGYVVAGYTYDPSAVKSYDLWVLKLDANGNVGPDFPGTWQKVFVGDGWDWAFSVQQTSDGGYIVAGQTRSFGDPSGDSLVLKLDGLGNIEWQNSYGGIGTDYCFSIQQTSDGGYIMAGQEQAFGIGNEFWVLKLGPDGSIDPLDPLCDFIQPTNLQGVASDVVPVTTGVSPADTDATPQPTLATVTGTNGYANILCGPVEVCNDGVDNDGDGFVDCDDPDCYSTVESLVDASTPLALDAASQQVIDEILSPADPENPVPIVILGRIPDEILVAMGNPPTANAGPNIGPISTSAVDTTTIQGTGSDAVDNDLLTYRWIKVEGETLTALTNPPDGWLPVVGGNCPLVPSMLGIGTHTLLLQVRDEFYTAQDEMILAIENWAPHVASTSGRGTYKVGDLVILGGQVSDYDGDDLSYKWTEGASPVPGCSGNVGTVEGGTPVPLPDCELSYLAPGTHTFTLEVDDGINDPVSVSVEVTVKGDSITLTPDVNTGILWPPDHKMVYIVIDTNAASGVTLTATVSSNEDQNGLGDGDMAPDWTTPKINGNQITLHLRAERSGTGSGRIYTINITATDGAGNSSTATLEIEVPHDQKK